MLTKFSFLRRTMAVSLTVALLVLFVSLGWAITEISSDLHENQQEFLVTECPFSFDERPAPDRMVLQIIGNELHKWEEHDLQDKRTCILLLRPEKRMLSLTEALQLLERSSQWVEHKPKMELREVLHPDDPQLDIPPATPPAQPQQVVYPENVGPDTDAWPSTPDLDNSQESYGALNSAEITLVPHGGVIGNDNRTRVNSTEQYPWWVIGYQRHEYSDYGAYRCTGFVVGPHMAMTNAHCVYNASRGGWADSASLSPAQSQSEEGGPIVRPYGTKDACTKSTNKSYTNADQAGTYRPEFDYAAMFFEDSFFDSGIKTFMPLVFDHIPTAVNNAGYPAIAQGEQTYDMWRAFDGSNVEVVGRMVHYTLDSSNGQSGSPVWERYLNPSRRLVVALHAFSNADDGFNGGPRLVYQTQNIIETWMENQGEYCSRLRDNRRNLPGVLMLLLDDE